MAWSRKHDRCLRCGTQTQRHVAKGFCVYCYRIENERKQRSHINEELRKRGIFASVSRDELEFQYKILNMSLSDLARKHNCTRQYIYKRLKYYGIRRRDKTKARSLALEKGKIAFSQEDEFGIKTKVTLHKVIIKEDFFKSWSPEMAYVLGVLYTDGNLSYPYFSVSQKEDELLRKVLFLMGCDSKIYYYEKRKIHSFSISHGETYEDLLRLGLTPRKSLTLGFPKIEPSCVRHFIRGCWDGDGSVYLERNDPLKPCASFTSGSKEFAQGILTHLISLGLREIKLHSTKGRNSFYFRVSGRVECNNLYHVLYDQVPEEMYLTRKYERFKSIAEIVEKLSDERAAFQEMLEKMS